VLENGGSMGRRQNSERRGPSNDGFNIENIGKVVKERASRLQGETQQAIKRFDTENKRGAVKHKESVELPKRHTFESCK